MDTLTHIAIGAVTGELVAGKSQGRKAALWGAIIANIPDFDVAAQPFLSPAQALLFHRGPMHSILFCVILVPLLALLITRIYKGDKNDKRDWFKLSAWCLFSHLFTDCFNTYGTAIFYPFSNIRVAFDSIGIFDAFFITPLLLCILCLIFIKREKIKSRRIIISSALILSALYLGFTIINKISLENKVKQELIAKNVTYNRILTAPLPITNFVWLIVIEDDNGFYLANCSRPHKVVAYSGYYKKNYNLAANFENDSEYLDLKRFSKGYYCLSEEADGTIVFYDLRFGSFDFDGTADLSKAVFAHELVCSEDGTLNLKHHYPKRKIDFHRLRRYLKQAINL